MKTWRVIDLIQWTTEYFERHNIPTPRLDAELLLGHLLQKSRLQLYLHFETPVFQEQLSAFRELVKKRVDHTPVSYLTNHREFMSLNFYVDGRVLIPRPETEILVETVLQSQKGKCRLIDIGTGSGAIAISLAVNCPDSEIVATDLSADALIVAQQNAALHHCADRLTFLQGNLFEPAQELESQRFDWIVSNPPYVSEEDFPTLSPDVRDHEPKIALIAGGDGLDIIRRLVADAPRFLNPHGQLIMEIGYNQSGAVQQLIQSNPAYNECQVIKDYSGIERVVIASV
ncbi:peptide chain release factor N(5)-glutamine methyltransferase [Candidatus Poribacteria bacterium]|nr:peptide chain release factor N(5)-glutamine methyltransferase [Candidatus Poribacteria bacterium]